MKKLILLLIIQLLINGCAVVENVIAKTIQPRMEKAKDITEGCKPECVTFTKYSDEWCYCMNQCNQDELNKINLDMTIHIEECPANPTKTTP